MNDTNIKRQVILYGKWYEERILSETEVLYYTIDNGIRRSKIFHPDEVGVIAENDTPSCTKEEIWDMYLG